MTVDIDESGLAEKVVGLDREHGFRAYPLVVNSIGYLKKDGVKFIDSVKHPMEALHAHEEVTSDTSILEPDSNRQISIDSIDD